MSECCCRQRFWDAPEGVGPEWSLNPLPGPPGPGTEDTAHKAKLSAPSDDPAGVALKTAAPDGSLADDRAAEVVAKVDDAAVETIDAVSTLASLPAPITSPRGDGSSPRSVSCSSDMESVSSHQREEPAAKAEFANKLGISPEDLYRYF